MPNARLSRLLRLMTLLRAHVGRRARDLASELGVSERTVYRDLVALGLAGVNCGFDRENGEYRIVGDFFLPPVQLTLGEALALSVLGSQLARGRQPPFLEDGWRAVTKVRSQLPASIREEVATADGHVRVQAACVSPQDGCGGHFETLRQAITRRRKVRCTYDGGSRGSDGRRPFLFRPYALFFNQRAWYVIGHSELRDAERSLKLNRLGAVTPTDRPYMIPDSWTLERTLGKAWRMIRGGRRYHVTIDFDREFGRNVADTLWHATQVIRWQPDGGCRFECDVDGLDEIVWWVLGYGPHAKVIGPPEFGEQVRCLASEMCRLYRSNERQDCRDDRIPLMTPRRNKSVGP